MIQLKFFKQFMLVAATILLFACTPKVKTIIAEERVPLEFDAPVLLLYPGDVTPQNTDFIGEVKITDTGMSTDCNLVLVLEWAKYRARMAGGNVLKLTKHRPPQLNSYCHEIEAEILNLDNPELFEELYHQDPSEIIPADSAYALFYVYRNAGKGNLVKYDLHLGDSAMVRVVPGIRETLKIRKDGLNRLWAKTEVIEEIPIDVEFGRSYYIQCGIESGWFVGRPSLQIVDPRTGSMIFKTAN